MAEKRVRKRKSVMAAVARTHGFGICNSKKQRHRAILAMDLRGIRRTP